METKKVPMVAERVDILESKVNMLERLAETMTKEMLMLRQYSGALAEVVSAMTDLGTLDNKQLMARIEKRKADAEKAEVESQKAKLKKGLEDGKLIYSGVVDESCIIAGKETNKDGMVLKDYSLVSFRDIDKNVKDLVLGKSVGDVITIPESQDTFEILEIYAKVSEVQPQSGMVN